MRGVLVTSVCVVSALFFACGSTDSPPGGSAGSAGSAGSSGSGGKAGGGAGESSAAGEGGASGADGAGAAGEGGAAGAPGSVCVESGTGDIDLIVEGLPLDVAASVTISGPSDSVESESTTLNNAPGGSYSVTAKRVYDADPLVRSAYDAQISSPTFCLDDGGNAAVTVKYSKVTPSNQLWTLNGGTKPVLGFGASTLTASGSPNATSLANLPLGTSMAFDHDGNLWAAGATLAEPTVSRYAAAWLGGVGVPRTDYAFNLALGCLPALKAVALDLDGNVWLSACGKRVLRIDRPESGPGETEEPIDIVANVTLSGFSEDNEDLAFDKAGNLWVAAGGRVLRFDRARLGHDDAAAPDLVLEVTTDEVTPQPLAANFLAFDLAGNLWASDFGANAVFEIGKTDLAARGSASAVAKVRVSLDVLAVMSRPAFDDAGALWLSLAAGKFGKLTAEQLAVSSGPGAPTAPAVVISSPDVGYADGIAFFPAASGLPLASAQP